jgi:VWFA-related protein
MKAGFTKWICALATVLIPFATVAQVPAGKLSAAVSLPFFVDDRHGNPVSGVTQTELSILDNKKPPQAVVAIQTTKQLPLRLGILIDTSGSENSNEAHRPGVKAAGEFVKQVLTGPEDKAFIVTFAKAPHATAFMSRNEFLVTRIDVSLGGRTALFDAAYLACSERMQTDPMQPARRVLVILSDGGDNMSRVGQDKVIAAAQAAGTVIFTVSDGADIYKGMDSRKGMDNRNLVEMADETGGQFFLAPSQKNVLYAFSKIREQIDNMYSVTYLPADPGQRGKFHSVELKPTSDPKLRLKIHAPKRYYPDAPQQ